MTKSNITVQVIADSEIDRKLTAKEVLKQATTLSKECKQFEGVTLARSNKELYGFVHSQKSTCTTPIVGSW